MNYADRKPQYQDEVKHKLNDTTGVVIATYFDSGERLDVRSSNGKVYYGTAASNWEVVRTEEDR